MIKERDEDIIEALRLALENYTGLAVSREEAITIGDSLLDKSDEEEG